MSTVNNFGTGPYSIVRMTFPTLPTPEFIVIREFLIPESMTYDGDSFIVGSIASGTISRVRTDGSVRVITPGNAASLLTQSFGVYKDPTHDILHVAVNRFPLTTNPGVQAAYVQIDLSTGNIMQSIDLTNLGPAGVARFCQDVRATPAGDVYLTDSAGSQIWHVSPAGVATSFFSDPKLAPNPTGSPGLSIGVNGIEYHPDGYLLLGVTGLGDLAKLYKLTLSDKTFTQVSVSGTLDGADGIVFSPNNTNELFVVGGQYVHRVTTTNGWKSASAHAVAISVDCVTPTAPAFAQDKELYVNCANQFSGPPSRIQRVGFPVGSASTLVLSQFALLLTVLTALFLAQ